MRNPKNGIFLLSLSFFISKVQDGRELQALPEHITTSAKSYFYCDNKSEIKTKQIVKSPGFVKKDAYAILAFFFGK